MIRIPHSRPSLTQAEVRALARVLASCQLGYGSTVHRFEEALCKFVGLPYAIAVVSGSAAIQLALVSMGVRPTDTVALPTYCCAAILNAVHHVGAKPLLVDIDPRDFNISLGSLRRAIARTKRIRAIIVPHMFGTPAPIGQICRLGIPVVEDCAMALGGRDGRGRLLGTIGEVCVSSFYATKLMTTGTGGAILTRDSSIAEDVSDLVRYDNRQDYRPRYNYSMGALQAALGIVQLRRFSRFLKRREQIARLYYRGLAGLPIRLPVRDKARLYYRFVIDLGRPAEGFIEYMARKGIECKRPVYKPLHHYFPGVGRFPGADAVHRSCVSIPIYPGLKNREISVIIKAIRGFFMV
jgi:dTDP-4-amino-4,6-dideoxygalactose transaminase